MLLQCSRSKAWHRASTAWLCSLLEPGTIVLDPLSRRWYLSLGHVSAKAAAAMGWPLEQVTVQGKSAFKLSTSTTIQDLQSLLVSAVEEWQAWDHEWCSLVGLAAKVAHMPALQEGLLSMVRGEPKPLLQLAAEKAFWKLPLIPIKK